MSACIISPRRARDLLITKRRLHLAVAVSVGIPVWRLCFPNLQQRSNQRRAFIVFDHANKPIRKRINIRKQVVCEKNILCVYVWLHILQNQPFWTFFYIECHPRWFVKCVVLVLIETNVQSHAFALFYGKKNTSSIKYILNFIYFMACFRPRKLTAFCSYSLMRARCGLLAMCELWNSIKLKRQNAQSSRASAASLPLSVAGSFSNNVKARTMKLYSIWSCGV